MTSELIAPLTLPFWTGGVGLLLGFLVALCTRHKTLGAVARSEARLLDISAELEHLLPQLVQNESTDNSERPRGAVVSVDQAALEARAESLLVERTQIQDRLSRASAEPAKSVARPQFVLGPQLTGALWGGLSVGVVALLYASVTTHSVPRTDRSSEASQREDLPSSPIASQPIGAAAVGQEDNRAEFRVIQAQLEQTPNDVPTLLRLAHLLLRSQLLEEAQTINDRVLSLRPNDLEALTHAAVLAAGGGHPERAQAGLAAVLKKDPRFSEAWFFRGMLAMQRGDMSETRESFNQYVDVAPPGPQRDRIASMLGQMNAS